MSRSRYANATMSRYTSRGGKKEKGPPAAPARSDGLIHTVLAHQDTAPVPCPECGAQPEEYRLYSAQPAHLMRARLAGQPVPTLVWVLRPCGHQIDAASVSFGEPT